VPRNEDVWGVEIKLLISALDGTKRSASRPARFTPGERAQFDKRLDAPQSRFERGGE